MCRVRLWDRDTGTTSLQIQGQRVVYLRENLVQYNLYVGYHLIGGYEHDSVQGWGMTSLLQGRGCGYD